MKNLKIGESLSSTIHNIIEEPGMLFNFYMEVTKPKIRREVWFSTIVYVLFSIKFLSTLILKRGYSKTSCLPTGRLQGADWRAQSSLPSFAGFYRILYIVRVTWVTLQFEILPSYCVYAYCIICESWLLVPSTHQEPDRAILVWTPIRKITSAGNSVMGTERMHNFTSGNSICK